MTISLNVPAAPASFYKITLEGNTYFFRFRWSTRSSCWYIDIEDVEGNVFTKNSKLVPGMPIIRQNIDKGPDGNIYVYKNVSVTTEIPSRYNIGPNKDFSLVYFTNEELQLVNRL